jgi:hypothetical protein
MGDLREIEVNPADTVKWTEFLARKDILWDRHDAGAPEYRYPQGMEPS